MFISTPAPDTVQAATSPVEGLVAGGVEQQQHDDEFVEQPFGGFADAAAAAGAGAHNDAQMQEEAAGVEQPFGFGSPAAVAAVADASVAELDDATEPSAPLLPISPAVLPAVSPAAAAAPHHAVLLLHAPQHPHLDWQQQRHSALLRRPQRPLAAPCLAAPSQRMTVTCLLQKTSTQTRWR
ncbi:hypothetical protein COO60DRAFT_584935 [Scenedesmus sp. NREL 46B-D3]|nr:hypothetical protein COO60DRAFT_584935 [Scenedesmus sp. NREL 46B-D3]